MYDLIVIGMGIGGITAGIYAKRGNLKVLLIDKGAPGGMLNNIERISNYPGLINIKGAEFSSQLFEQVKDLEIQYKFEEVIELKVEDTFKRVITNRGEYTANNIIIATGSKPKYLGLDNEKDLLGRGVSTCATCDGAFYRDKKVAVVGSGNSALQESLYLANICSKVYLLNRKAGFKGEDILVEKVKNHPNIEIIYGVNIKEYGEIDGKIESVILDNETKLSVSGVFIYIGYRPNTDIFNNLNITNMQGHIVVNDNFETEIEGVYAIGDVIKKDIYQLVTAASDAIHAVSNISKINY
ncbi:MAG: thioredoxin-disulfide reductase [Firmicutes bacterium]|nr:thioredoxin-disulfide reductase [Bacillota bacterium]